MSLTYNTGTTASATSTVTSKTFTIPAGVLVGDGMLLLFTAYSEASGSGTLSVTSTGSAWTQIGTTVYVSTSNFETNSSLWYCSAASADPGATVTLHSTTALFMHAELVSYTGAALTGLIDASASAPQATAGETFTAPATSTIAANDWAIYAFASCCDGSTASAATPPSGTTVRQSLATTGGISSVADGHAALAAGTSIGGGTFTTTVNACGVTWSVALASLPLRTGFMMGF